VLRSIRIENISPKIIIQSSPSSARRYEAPDQEPVVTVIDHQRYESEDRELPYANNFPRLPVSYFARASNDSDEDQMAADIAQIRRLRSGDIQNLTIEEQQEDINAV
jgi:hypothetical protein